MLNIFVAILISMVSLGLQVAVAGPPRSTSEEITGHYYLQGAREVGSELVLQNTGEFRWMLSYGATDLYARGTWKRKGVEVVLTPLQPAKGEFRLFKEGEMNLRKLPSAGLWVALVGIPRTQPIDNIEVRFVSASGKSATAISQTNGDAIVNMPASERWVRAGLRRAGTTDEWQWIDVPQDRATARIAGFAVLNWEQIVKPPFKTLGLRIAPLGLQVQKNSMGLTGVYEKPIGAERDAMLIHCDATRRPDRSTHLNPTCPDLFFPVFGRSPPVLLAALP